jgi:HK97 gp10 family phage protein
MKKRKEQLRFEIKKALKRGNFAEAQRLRHPMRQPWLNDRPAKSQEEEE